MSKTVSRIVGVIWLVGLLTPALATEQIYHPINPVLGGNPNNGPALLSAAQSQGEGAKSGNQGPDLTPLADALKGSGTTTTPPASGSTPPRSNQPQLFEATALPTRSPLRLDNSSSPH